MNTEREYAVTFIITTIAILVVIGGYASFSGLASYNTPLTLLPAKDAFKPSDVFDVTLAVNPVTFLSDESIMIYIDGQAIGAVAIKKYVTDNRIEYGSEIKNLGNNDVEIITLKRTLSLNLADFVMLDNLTPGTTHALHVEFSRGDAVADASFRIE